MNTILPTGISRLNTASSKFNLESGSVLIGLNAGTQLEELDNVFVGNSAGSESTFVSESVFLGMYAGQYVRTGKKSIIIGHDKSSVYLGKTNILSIGYNNVERESIAIGSNINSTGNNNIAIGRDITTDSYNSFAYGKNITIRNNSYFIDYLSYNNNPNILSEGFNKIGLLDIKTQTNINYSNIFSLQYNINNYARLPDSICNRETDIIMKFKPTQDFNFNISFNIDSCNLINFNIKDTMISYTNNEVILDFPIYYNITLDNVIKYNEYNTIHIINNDKIYKSLSLYINPFYDGFVISPASKNYNEQGFITNIRNNNINNIIISYDLSKNKINSNYIYNTEYDALYPDKDSSNISLDYKTFNNATNIVFKDFIVSINDNTTSDTYNITYGRNVNIKGGNNICIGQNQSVAGDNSILIGNDIYSLRAYKDTKNSIVIGNTNFINANNKDVILIGNSNLNMHIVSSNEESFNYFLQQKPIIIGSSIDTFDYTLNIGNSLVKYDTGCNQIFLLGMQRSFLPIAIGYSCNNEVPIKDLYKLNYQSNIYLEYETSNAVSNYYIDGIQYEDIKQYTIASEILDVQITNNIVLTDDKYAMYVKNGIHCDALSVYNSSNYNIIIKNNEKIKQNIKYTLPDILEENIYANKTPLLSYEYIGGSNALYWKTLEDTLKVIDVYSKNIISTGYIYSSDFVGIGSNLFAVNLHDRDTSLLKEGSNLYYTAERAGVIAHASNVKAMNYTLSTSNEIMHFIQDLNTKQIAEIDNLYYTDERFDNRLLTKSLDSIYNGTSNKFITNDIYTNNLLITGTLTVGKIQVLGIDFPKSMHNVAFASTADIAVLTEQIRDLSQEIDKIKNRLDSIT